MGLFCGLPDSSASAAIFDKVARNVSTSPPQHSRNRGTRRSALSSSSQSDRASHADSLEALTEAIPMARATSAYRTFEPGHEKRVTVGSNTELDNPCGRRKSSPSGRLIPCTRHTLEFVNASPPCSAATDIASRASAFPGSAHAVRRLAWIFVMHERATGSVSGFALRETYASIPWVRASTPT